MDIRTLPGTTGARLVELLANAYQTLSNVRSGNSQAIDVFNAYLEWASSQAQVLGAAVSQESLDLLVTTRRHWALYNLNPATKGSLLRDLVDTEIVQQVRMIDATMTQLRNQIGQYSGADRLVVPDTNVFLHTNDCFNRLDWSLALAGEYSHQLVVIPLLVIDEIDKAKQSTGTIGPKGTQLIRSRARATLKVIEDEVLPTSRPQDWKAANFTVHVERPGHVRLPDPDSEILDQAQALGHFTGLPLAILTLDTGMRARAHLSNVTTLKVPNAWLDFKAGPA